MAKSIEEKFGNLEYFDILTQYNQGCLRRRLEKKKNRHGRWRSGSVCVGLSSDFPTKEIVEHIGHESGVPEKNLQNEFGRCPAKADLVSVRIGKVGFSAFLFPMEISLSSVDKEVGKLCESTESGVSVLITLPRNEFVVPATQDNVILCGSCTSHSGVGVGVVVGFHNVSVFACFYYIILTFDQILSKNFHFFLFFFLPPLISNLVLLYYTDNRPNSFKEFSFFFIKTRYCGDRRSPAASLFYIVII